MSRTPITTTTKAEPGVAYSVARSSSKYLSALASVPRDGEWWVVASDLAPSTAEQISRKLNSPGAVFEFGHRQLALNGQLRSELAARYTSVVAPTTLEESA